MTYFPWRGLAAAALLCRAGVAAAAEEAGPSSPPEAVSPEELRRLEESLGADAPAPAPAPTAPLSGLANPDLALVLDVAGAYFSDDPLQVGAHDPAATGFSFQQLELTLGAAADPFFRFDGALVFGEEGVEVEEAYATTLALPANLQLRAGQFLTRFGRLNPTHPHTWAFVDRPLAPGKFFGPEGSRGVGLEGSWLAPLPWFVELVASANVPAAAHAHDEADGEAEEAPRVEDLGDLLYTTALKQFFAPGEDWGLLLGVSAAFAPGTEGIGRTTVTGVDLLVRFRPVASADRAALSLQLEALHRTREAAGRTLEDAGLYAQLAWSIDPRWEAAVRQEHVSGVRGDPLDPAWSGGRRRTAAQVSFLPSHFSRIRLQANRDDPTWRGEALWAAFLQLELAVGAHGSHPY